MTKHKKVVWEVADISATSWIPVNRLYLQGKN